MIQLFKQTTGNLGLSKGVPLKGRPGLSLQQTSHGRKWKKTGQEPVAGHALFTKATVSELEKEKTQLQNALKEWKAKVYKPNKKVITTGDKDAFMFSKRSITQLNEKRRNDAIRNIQSQITDIDEAIVRVGKKEQEEKSEATYQKVVKERKQTEAEKAAGIESKMKEFNPLDVLLGKALLSKAQPIKGRPGIFLDPLAHRYKQTQKKSKEYVIWGVPKGQKHETLLLEKPQGKTITDRKTANKFVKVLESKFGATKIRVQEIDMSKELDWMKEAGLKKAMPSKAQAEAGNYKMQHYRRDGMDISIENPKGSYRQGVTREGKKWRTQLKHHYGYIRGTRGIDKDHVDVFIKPGSKEGLPVHVVNQCDPKSGKFDEHKCMMGFDNEAEAKKAYHANYQKGWKGFVNIVTMPMDEFKTWVKSSAPRKGEAKAQVKKSMLLILDIFKGTPLKNKPGLALVVTNKGKRWKRIGEKPKAVRPGAKPQVAQPVEKKPAAPVKRAPRRTHDWLKRKGGEYDEKAMASSLKKAGFKNSKDIAEAVSFYTQASVVGMGMKESSTGSYIIKRVELGKKIPDGAMRYLEQVNKVDKNRLIQIAENLENFIDTAPAYDGLIYNGSKKSAMDRGWSKGDTIQFDTVRSFSSDRGVTNDFGQWKIITNAPDKSVGIANISYYDEEQEVLVGKGAKFTVDDIDVDLKEIYLSPTNGLEKAMKDAAEPKKEPKANKKYSRYTIDNDDVTVIKKGDKDAAI